MKQSQNETKPHIFCQSKLNVCVLQQNHPALYFSSYSGDNDFLGYLFQWLNGLAIIKMHLGLNLVNDIELDYGFFRGGFLVDLQPFPCCNQHCGYCSRGNFWQLMAVI